MSGFETGFSLKKLLSSVVEAATGQPKSPAVMLMTEANFEVLKERLSEPERDSDSVGFMDVMQIDGIRVELFETAEEVLNRSLQLRALGVTHSMVLTKPDVEQYLQDGNSENYAPPGWPY